MIFNINEITRSIPSLKKAVRFKAGKKQLAKINLNKTDGVKINPHTSRGVGIKKIARVIFGNFNLNKNSAKVLLALLYWSSGSKYPSSNFVSFSNSDSNLVKTFLNLLRKTFDINESRIKIHLQLYLTQDKKKMTEFWSKLLNVSQKQFYNPTITKPPTHPRPNYFGTCTVRYHSLELLLTIMELCKELGNAI